jgi:hypothetical protein
MHAYSRFAAVFGAVASLATAGCASNGSVTPATSGSQAAPSMVAFAGPGWITKDGISYHVPHYMYGRRTARAARITPDTTFSYYGGPVLVAPKVYLILWNFKKYGDPDNVAALLETYFTNMGGSGHNNIYTQYYQTIDGVTSYVTNPASQYAGVWTYKKKAPTHPTDLQVAKVALAGAAHFGYDRNGSYVVASPYKHDPAAGAGVCAYHSNVSANGHTISYTNLPYMPDLGSDCGANYIAAPPDESGVDEGVTIVEGHEEGESVTDPIVGLGWYNSTYGEIGDICAWQDIANDSFANGSSYTMQPMFSNASQSCVHTY